MMNKSYILFKHRVVVSYLRALLRSVSSNSRERDKLIRSISLDLCHEPKETYEEIEKDIMTFLNKYSGISQMRTISMFYKNSSDYLDKVESMPFLKANDELLRCLKKIRKVVESHKISITDEIRHKSHHKDIKSIRGYYRKMRARK